MWNKLYNAEIKVQNYRTISPFIDTGALLPLSSRNKAIFMLVFVLILLRHLECVRKETPLQI